MEATLGTASIWLNKRSVLPCNPDMIDWVNARLCASCILVGAAKGMQEACKAAELRDVTGSTGLGYSAARSGEPASKTDRGSRRAGSRHLESAKRFHGYHDPCRRQQNVRGQGSSLELIFLLLPSVTWISV